MNGFNPLLLAALGLGLLAGVAITSAVMRRVRARRRAQRRVVERPNSHYTPQLVRDHETRHRWHNIALERIHEINRDEVRRLLEKVEAAGIDSLRPAERVFLDNVAELTGAAAPDEAPGRAQPIVPDLRHRPA